MCASRLPRNTQTENFGRVCLRASHRLSILCQLSGCVFLVPLLSPFRVPPVLCPLFPSFARFSPSLLSGALSHHRTSKDGSAMCRTLASYCGCLLAKLTQPLFMPLVETQYLKKGHSWPLAPGELSHGLLPPLWLFYSSGRSTVAAANSAHSNSTRHATGTHTATSRQNQGS